MNPSSRTPEGEPKRCPICGNEVMIEPSHSAHDAPCPHCGSLLWFTGNGGDGVFGFHRFSFSGSANLTKEQAISGILERLVEARALAEEHYQGVRAAVLKREQLGSTGIGWGVAIPHAKYPGIQRLLAAIATFSEGIPFDSVDGVAVKVMCLISSPADRPGDHLRVLEQVARRLREGL